MTDEPNKVEVLEESFEALADNIAQLSNLGEAIKKSSLKQRTLLILLRDITGLPMNHIQYVLNALPSLEETYLKKGKTK